MGDLSENKPFEAEVRFFVSDFDEFKKRVDQLDLNLISNYSFTDHYFKPKKGNWNSLEKTLRIRVWRSPNLPTAIYLTKDEIRQVGEFSCKRSVYPRGKKILYKGSFEECSQVLEDLGFVEVYVIDKKNGWVWQSADKEIEFCIEDTDLLGWTGEMEIDGSNGEYIKQRINRHKDLLHLKSDDMSYKPMAALIEDRLSN